MSTTFGPLDELIGCLLETWGQRYAFECDREHRVALLTRDEMQARVDELPTGMLRVTYQHAPNQDASELCTPTEAAALVEAVLFRQHLCRVPKPPLGQPAGGQRSWWRRIFGL
jgi:hypothetical protein